MDPGGYVEHQILSNSVYMDYSQPANYYQMPSYRWRVQEFTRKMNPEAHGAEIEEIAVEADRFIQAKHHSTTSPPTITTTEHNGYVTVFIMYLEVYTPDEPAYGSGSLSTSSEPLPPGYRYEPASETQALSQALRAYGPPAVRLGTPGEAEPGA